MRRILALGEAIVDVIVEPDGTAVIKAGGSMLNSAVSLGRCGLDVCFSGVVGDDRQGRFIREFLIESGVDVEALFYASYYQTPIAMAWLDEKRNATYSFYKENIPENTLKYPKLNEDDIFLFGSFYSLNNRVRNDLEKYLLHLNKNKVNVVYDPNFRSPHKKDLNIVIDSIKYNLRMSNVVRASNEDLYHIFGLTDPQESWELIRKFGVDILIYTMAENGGVFFCRDYSFSFSSEATDIVSTIGAGDAFNAGMINAMLERNLKSAWTRDDAEFVVRRAGNFAAKVCVNLDNYITEKDAKMLLSMK